MHVYFSHYNEAHGYQGGVGRRETMSFAGITTNGEHFACTVAVRLMDAQVLPLTYIMVTFTCKKNEFR